MMSNNTNMKRLLLFLLLTWVAPGLTLLAQPPAGYYQNAGELTGQELQQALHSIIDEHKILTYSELWDAFKTTDARDDGTVWDIYSDIPGKTPPYVYHFSVDQCGNYAREGDCYNREHSFPKSWFGDAEPMYTDLFHIYATDGWVNNKRGNLPYGETMAPRWSSLNGSHLGPSSVQGYAGDVFEPVDEYKGDLARTYFYMATRYYGEGSAWPGSDMVMGSQLKPWALAMLLKWHENDPVSIKETSRNNAIYALQKNRNPFIDHPRYALLIWDLANDSPLSGNPAARLTLWPNPAASSLNLRIQGNPSLPQTVIITDMAGSEVFRSLSREEELKIDLNHFSPGVYVVRIISTRESFSTPFVRVPAQ